MATLYMMIGNIGSGKTTIAKKLQEDNKFAMYISDDEITTMLNGEYKDTYFTEKHQVLYHELVLNMVKNILNSDYDVIVDSGLNLISSQKRLGFIQVAKEANANIVAYDISHPNSLERRLSQDISEGGTDWRAVHVRFEKEYDKPSTDEGIDEIIVINGKV